MPQKKQRAQNKTVMTQVLLFQPTIETSDETLQAFLNSVQKLPMDVPYLLSASAGENQSLKHKGFTHGVILLFENETYLRDAVQQPAYQKLNDTLQSISDHTIVFEQPVVIDVPAIEVPSKQKQTTHQEIKKATPGKSKKNAAVPQASPILSEWQQIARTVRQNRVTHIDQRLVTIVCEQLDVDEQDVIPSASFVEDLNADSLDLVELFISFENVFKIQIPDEYVAILTTAGETQSYLELTNAL